MGIHLWPRARRSLKRFAWFSMESNDACASRSLCGGWMALSGNAVCSNNCRHYAQISLVKSGSAEGECSKGGARICCPLSKRNLTQKTCTRIQVLNQPRNRQHFLVMLCITLRFSTVFRSLVCLMFAARSGMIDWDATQRTLPRKACPKELKAGRSERIGQGATDTLVFFLNNQTAEAVV